MKIVCDNCSTKYSISDDKIRGKVFKIKCKKCGHVIVVKGTETDPIADSDPSAQPSSQTDTKIFDYSGIHSREASQESQSAETTWHLVIEREQVGPMSVADVQAKWTSGQIDGDTYAWREGFADWQRMSAIEELAEITHSPVSKPAANPLGKAIPGSTGRSDPADLFAAMPGEPGEDEGPDLFARAHVPALGGSRDEGPVVSSASANVSRPPVAASAPLESPVESPPRMTGDAPAAVSPVMTGQRNDTSVLFSLSNLAALATQAPKSSSGPVFQPGTGTEGSGLIDIRAMAAMTLGSRKDSEARTGDSKDAQRERGQGGQETSADDLPVFSTGAFTAPTAGVLLPSMQPGLGRKWLYVTVGLAGLALVAVAAVVFVLLRSNDSQPVVAMNDMPPASGPAPTRSEPIAPVPEAAKLPTAPTPAISAPPSPVVTPAPAASAPPRAPGSTAIASSSRTHASQKPDPKPDKKREGSSEKKPVADIKPPPTGDCTEVDCAIDPDRACCKKRLVAVSKKPLPPDNGLPDLLTTADVKEGMRAVTGRVMACYDQHKQAGVAKVRITVSGATGGVTSAEAQEAFKGTPTGSCVERAVKSARFKRFKAASMSVKYPFTLR